MVPANHPDLFGDGEPDLFGAREPVYVPNPEHVRNRLAALLAAMRGGQVWPWNDTIVALHREKTFDYLLGLLPEEEAARWRGQIETEIARLDATAIAAE